ncbi:MAG: hypothetical protein EXR65_05240 [Dehalococcoidia bacterium]|nr:hypothetical protein [Dehalococcoidia bacterium]
MNVVLNTDEGHVVMTMVTAQVLDHVALSEAGRSAVREWRRGLAPGTVPLDGFTERLNLAIGNFIDERTTRMMRLRGKVKVREDVL